MKYITLLFTTIFFLAFAEAQAAVDIEPAFPTWVESGFDDPPDCSLEAAPFAEAIYIVIEAPEQILFIRQQPPAFFKLAATRISTQPKPFVYMPYVSAGGVGRLCSVFCLVFIPNPAAHNDFLHVLNGTSGGMGRIREANYLAALVNV